MPVVSPVPDRQRKKCDPTCEQSLCVLCTLVSQVAKANLAPGQILKDMGQSNYTPSWTLHSLIISRMRAAGVKSLTPDKCDVSRFARCFPDQLNSFSRFRTTSDNMTCKAFFRELQYTGPPELWAMYACQFQGAPIDRASAIWLQEHKDAMRDLCASYKKANGQNPVPGLLLKLYLLSLKQLTRRRRKTEPW